uniref:Carboxylic ester hydrolase n=1 Tax=Glossina brevipalpis TaxID=37001 RepID=A0A1A9W502_9MUSC
MNISLAFFFEWLIILAIADITIQYPAESQEGATMTLHIPGQGSIVGGYGTTLWSERTFMQFLGIPYAESPREELRFKLAVKRKPWTQILNTSNYGRRCPSLSSINKIQNDQIKDDLEDCLNLCVYTKDLDVRRPVMFYVYGGGFFNGSNEDHPPGFLLEKDIVLVVPNYRIGALGFLSLGNEDIPGNVPIGDLTLALQWVQDYIQYFGGDAKQVTVFGQSAGAAMLGALLLSPKTPSGLFHRSIIQSGSIISSWGVRKDYIRQIKRLCYTLACGQCTNNSEIYTCVRNVSVGKLLESTKSESFGPVLGDYYGYIPQEPLELHKEKKNSVPLMTGFTKHDGSFVLAIYYDGWKKQLPNLSNVTVRQFANGLFRMINDNGGIANNLLMKLLFPKDIWQSDQHEKALAAYFDVTNIAFMKSPTVTFAQKMLEKHSAPVYLYSFDYDGSNTRFGYGFGHEHYPFSGGIHHSNENIYLFPTHLLNDDDKKIAQKMVDLWTSFVINGKPQTKDSPEILPMEDELGPYFHIDTNITLGYNVLDELSATVDDPEHEKLHRKHIKF